MNTATDIACVILYFCSPLNLNHARKSLDATDSYFHCCSCSLRHLFAFAAPAAAGGSPRSPEAAIKAENARWADAFARGDYEAIGRLYTRDGTLLPPGGDKIKGSSAIVGYFTKGMPDQNPPPYRSAITSSTVTTVS